MICNDIKYYLGAKINPTVLQTASTVYRQSKSSHLPFLLLGPQRLLYENHLLKNIGVVANRSLYIPKNPFLDPKGQAILGDKDWTPFVNLLFLLGGVDGNKEFHLVSDTSVIDWRDLWNQKKKKLRVLGTEIEILQHLGCKPHNVYCHGERKETIITCSSSVLQTKSLKEMVAEIEEEIVNNENPGAVNRILNYLHQTSIV